MTNPELPANDHVDTKEEMLLRKEAKDTNLYAYPDLVNVIAYKYAGKTDSEKKDDVDAKDFYKDEVTKTNAKEMLAPFQRIAMDHTFGVKFLQTAVESDAPYEDIQAIDSLIDSMSKGEIVLLQKEIDALKQTIENPQEENNQYENIADFSSKQNAESWNVTELVKGNATLAEKFKKSPKLLQDWEVSETERKSDVSIAIGGVPGVDADSIHNISAELTMTRLEKTSKQLESGNNDVKIDTVFDNSLEYANSMLDKTANALKEIQTTTIVNGVKKMPVELSELPLFMMPGELRNFYNTNGDEEQPAFTQALSEAMNKDENKGENTTERVDKNTTQTLEQLMEQKMPQLTQKDQDALKNYVDLVGKQQKEGTTSNMTEGLKGIFEQISEIIKAIRGGFAEVWEQMDPDAKAALTSLGILNVEEIDEMMLKKNGTMEGADVKVHGAAKKDLFDGANTEDCFSNLFNDNSSISSLTPIASSDYIKLNKGSAKNPQDHMVDNMLAVLHKNNVSGNMADLKDEDNERNRNKLDEKYKDYKQYMINTVRAGQNVRRDKMEPQQQQEMISRSLVKNNFAALLYYKTTVLPAVNRKESDERAKQVAPKPATTVTEALVPTTPTYTEQPSETQ